MRCGSVCGGDAASMIRSFSPCPPRYPALGARCASHPAHPADLRSVGNNITPLASSTPCSMTVHDRQISRASPLLAPLGPFPPLPSVPGLVWSVRQGSGKQAVSIVEVGQAMRRSSLLPATPMDGIWGNRAPFQPCYLAAFQVLMAASPPSRRSSPLAAMCPVSSHAAAQTGTPSEPRVSHAASAEGPISLERLDARFPVDFRIPPPPRGDNGGWGI